MKLFGIKSMIAGNMHTGNDILLSPNNYVNFDIRAYSLVFGKHEVIHYKENLTEGIIIYKYKEVKK